MNTEKKECPECKEQILANASTCPYCGAHFAIVTRGYCTACHKVTNADENNRCTVCKNAVVDPHLESHYLGNIEPAPLVVDPFAKKKTTRPGRSCAILGLLLITIAAALFIAPPSIKNRFRLPGAPVIQPPSTQVAAAREKTRVATPTSVPQTDTPRPTPTKSIQLPLLGKSAACFANNEFGITCLDQSGWQSLDIQGLPARSPVYNLTTCPDGKLLWLTTTTLYSFDGRQWKELDPGDYGGGGLVACRSSEDIWIIDYDGASHFDGSAWVDYPMKQMDPDGSHLMSQGIALDPQGKLWIATDNNILHFDGQAWTVFGKGKGLAKDYTMKGMAVDSKGNPWAAHSGGLLTYTGKTWKPIGLGGSYTINCLAVDTSDRVWVGTNRGVSLWGNGQWAHYNSTGKLGGVVSLAVDAKQRVWAGTRWGVGILEKNKWTAYYHMHSTGLSMNHIRSVAVQEDGPQPIELVETEPGSISGRLVAGSQPLSKIKVEVCVEPLGTIFSGATPCTGQPFMAGSTTDVDGRFTIPDLPAGYYSVTFRTPDGKWKVLSETLRIGAKQVLVSAGETRTLEEMDISK